MHCIFSEKAQAPCQWQGTYEQVWESQLQRLTCVSRLHCCRLQVMPPYDAEMVEPVHERLRSKGVQLCLGDGVQGFEQQVSKPAAWGHCYLLSVEPLEEVETSAWYKFKSISDPIQAGKSSDNIMSSS